MKKFTLVTFFIFAVMSCSQKDNAGNARQSELTFDDVTVSEDCTMINFSASISSEYSFDTVGFEYGEDAKLGASTKIESSLSSDGRFRSAINIEKFGQLYYVRAFASNNHMVLFSDTKSFKIPGLGKYCSVSKPSVEITSKALKAFSAITSADGLAITACGFQLSNSAEPFSPLFTANGIYEDGLIHCEITDVEQRRFRYIRSFATVGNETIYSELTEIIVPMELITLSKPIVSTITAESASVSVTVVDESETGISECGIIFSDMPGFPTGFITKLPLSKTGDTLYSTSISGLKPNTTYYVRAYAVNPAGTSYSQDVSFETPEEIKVVMLPSVENPEISSITSNSAKITVVISDDGGGKIYKCGIVYSDTKDIPVESSTRMELKPISSLSFSSGLSDLKPGYTYYIRAYATNSAGTMYSRDVSFTTTIARPSLNGHEYVDLGLPSKIKWATCNIGSTVPENIGTYYSWGENEGKNDYKWENYKFFSKMNGQSAVMSKYTRSYETETLDSGDDTATQKWGAGWRMPTTAEWVELSKECELTLVTINDNTVFNIVGPNGAAIVLPAKTGLMIGTELLDTEHNFYWTCMRYVSRLDSAYNITFGWGSQLASWYPRCYGLQVRAVCD